MMNPDAEVDLREVEPPPMLKVACAVQGVSGIFVGLAGLQTVGLIFRIGALAALPYGLMLLGVGQIVLAALMYRARAGAAFGSAATSSLAVLATMGWLVYGILGEFYSCVAFIAVPLSLVSAILAFVAIPLARRVNAARRRLADQGMSLGL